MRLGCNTEINVFLRCLSQTINENNFFPLLTVVKKGDKDSSGFELCISLSRF